MKLFTASEINKKRNDQNRELLAKNERLVSSLKKTLKLQNDIDFDAEKAKKMKEYNVWLEQMQAKQSNELKQFEIYKKLTEDKKDEYHNWIARIDDLQDKILDLKEEVDRLNIQLKWKQEIINKQNG